LCFITPSAVFDTVIDTAVAQGVNNSHEACQIKPRSGGALAALRQAYWTKVQAYWTKVIARWSLLFGRLSGAVFDSVPLAKPVLLLRSATRPGAVEELGMVPTTSPKLFSPSVIGVGNRGRYFPLTYKGDVQGMIAL